METSVDTLVYQLEDDDTNVRWNTLQKLRRIAAVETSHFPVRNTRRFLQCVRRRIVNETDPHVAIEALRLLGDVMVSLGDNVDQLLSSILPHLIPILPRKPKNNEQEEDSDGESDALYEEVFQIFRKYANVTSDLQAAADVLVNIGLGSGQGSVREASLIVLVRLLDERFLNRSRGHRRESIGRGDKALIMALVQAIIPALEDADEKVVVAAEEAIAKLESYWGSRFSSDVMKFLSGEDKRTLMEHQEPISAFLQACNTSSSPLASRPDSAASSSSSDTREDLSNDAASTSSRSSPSKVHPLQMTEELRFGFLKGSIVTTLTTHTSNSNADWKKRAAAVEKLYATCKEVDASDLRGFTMEEQATRMNELETFFDILVRLTQDVDVHLVKRALQITQIIFRKLSPPRIDKTLIHTDGKDSDGRKKDSAFYMKKVLAPMVETAANFAEDDDEMESFVYTLLGQFFESGCVSVNLIEQILATTSLRHRRSQVREEAVKVWIVLLLISEREGLLLENYAPNDDVVQLLGRLLGDSNRGVRDIALEVSAVLTMVCDCNIYALLEAFIDDEYVAERVDWAALRMRLRRKQVLELRSNNTLRSKISGTANCVRACRTGLLAPSVEQSLDGVSVMKMMVAKDVQKPLEHGYHETITTATGKVNTGDSLSDRSYFGHEQTGVDDARASSSEEGPATVDINDKLAALRKKVGQLRPPRTKRIRVPYSQEGSPTDTKVQVMPRSKSSPEQSAFNPVDDQIPNEDLQSQREKHNKGRRTVVLPVTKAYSSPPQQPAQLSPQHLQSLQSDAQNYKDHPKSTFTERQKAPEPSGSRESPDERPIRPGDPDQIYLNLSDQEHSQDFDNNDSQSTKKTHGRRVMSLATRKRLEAKAKQDTKSSGHSCKIPSPVQNEISKPWNNPVKIKGIGTVDEAPRSSGKQEPRYLEPHELTPLVNPKQDLSKVLSQLRSEDWEGNFEALSTVRRLALHHANLLDAGKVHAILAEIMNQIPNLRSTVSKNALLALESMCAAFSRDMDSEVENIVPVLLKRCGDSNTFVCESAAASLRAVVLQCSISRVVLALASHGNSKAVPIRREVARALHALIVDKADNIERSKDLSSVLQLVGRSLEDSNNEVRDIAKQSILYLHFQRRVVSERIKKFLSPSAHAKIDSLLSGKVGPLSMSSATSDTVFEVTSASKKREALPSRTKKLTKQLSGRTSPPTTNNGARSKVNNDELLRLETKLGSNNWKDRFDALNETTEFFCGCAPALVESGQMLNLFDQLIKRLDDGNAKVNVLALECMDTIVPSLGSGMEQVLPNFLPAITKNLANSRTSSLAQSIVQHLCVYVDNRSLCQQFAIQARSANTRVLPFLLDTLAELTARSLDDKSTYVLTRHVLPLALNLLKEAKSDVKEGNAKLLRQLRKTLGPTAMSSAASKLNSAQQGKLAAALR